VPLVAIIDSNEPDLIETSRMLIGSNKVHVVGVARRLDEIPRVMTTDPDIALFDVGEDTTGVVPTLLHILELSPRCQVILTAPKGANIDLIKAVHAGARGLLNKPFTQDELMSTLTEVFQTELLRTRRIEEQATAKVTQGRAGEVITVFSPKGGTGCTVIATHLATALAGIEKSKVALLDFDLQFGDIAVHLNLNSNHTVHELMRSVNDLDGAMLNDVMVQHSASGVRVLLPPISFEQVDEIDTDGLLAVVKAVRKHYDYVVIDVWHSLEDATLALIDLSDTLLVVTTPEVPALRNTRRFLDFIRERPRRSKAQIILNRYPSKSAIPASEIERSLGVKPIATIPSDGRLITTAVNEGITILGKNSPATASIKQVAATIAKPRLARLQRERQDGRVPAGRPADSGARA
jgi:pilus assembly protein CpaE